MKPRSLILVLEAFVCLAAAQSSSTSSPALGDFVAQGIGAAPTPSTASSRSYINTTSSTTTTHRTVSNGTMYNCTDSACGLACSSSWSSWSSASTKWINAFATTSTSVVSYYNATVTEVPIATSNGSVYATCDGIPRYSGSVNYWTTTNRSIPATSTTWYEIATATGEVFKEPAPSCVIQGVQCDSMISDWHASNYLAFPFNQSTGFYDYWPNGPPTDFPHCNTSQTANATDFTDWLNDTFVGDGSGCWVKGASARLFYWPEPVAEHNSTQACPDGTYTAAPTSMATNATAPVTKVVTLSETYYNCCTTTVTMTSPTMYLSMQDVEGRDASWGFAGKATVVPIAPGDLVSQVIAPPLITDEALSSSAMSIIAHQEVEKYTDLFGYNWQQHQSGLGGPNIPLQTTIVNPADLGKPPQPLSYYFGAAGWYCLNADPFALHNQPVSAGLPPGMKCDTIYDDYYRPWVQIPSTIRSVHGWSTCNMMFGWDPPIALTAAATVAGPGMGPGQASATPTSNTQAPTTPASPGSPSIHTTTPTAEPEVVSNSNLNADPSTCNGDQSHQSGGEAADPTNQGPSAAGTTSNGGDQQTPNDTGDPTTAPPMALTPVSDPLPAATTPQGSNPEEHSNQPQPAMIGTLSSGGAAVTIVSDTSANGQVIAISSGGSTTLRAGEQGSLASQHVSVNSAGGVIVNTGTTVNIGDIAGSGQSPAATAPVFSVGNHHLTAGGPAQTVSDVVYSALPSGGIVAASGDSSKTLTAASNGQLDLGNGMTAAPVAPTAAPASAGALVVAGHTLNAGGPAMTTNGVTYSVLPSGQVIAGVDGSSSTFTAASNGQLNLGNGITAAAVTPTAVQDSDGAVVVGGHTLNVGGSAMTTNGITYSALPSAQLVAASHGSTSTLTAASNGQFDLGSSVEASIVPSGGVSASALVFDGHTLNAGGSAVTANGATYSALPSGSGIIVASGGKPTTYSPHGTNGVISIPGGQYATLVADSGAQAFVTTVNGQAISGVPDGIVVDGKTVTSGGAAQTISGVAYSLASDGHLVVGGSSILGANGFGNLLGAIETAAAMGNGSSATASASASVTGGAQVTTGGARSTGPSTGGSGGPAAAAAASSASSTQSAASPRIQISSWSALGVSFVLLMLGSIA